MPAGTHPPQTQGAMSMNVHTITTTIKGICAADPDEAVKAALEAAEEEDDR